MNYGENIRIALRGVRSNLLRSILTMCVIGIGIMALVGILTALDSIMGSLSDNFSIMGANTFNIVRKGDGIRGSHRGKRPKKGPEISFEQAMQFKDRYQYPANPSVSTLVTRDATIKYQTEKTNPNVRIQGVDENYLSIAGYDIDLGRNFSPTEVENGRNVAIIGKDIIKKVFNNKKRNAVDKLISIGSVKYKVIGVLESKGSGFNSASDRLVLIPIITARRYFGSTLGTYSLAVNVNQAANMETAVSEATGTFRGVRKLRLSEDDDFEIIKSDSLVSILSDSTRQIRLATIFIALITLFGAAIGLMNIMLVSVTERTREIGIRKSLGASRQNVLIQFLTEAVVICQLGGLLGIIMGLIMGNFVSFITGGSFIIPWVWMILGITLCFFIGIVSGLYPALKAARLDPIESLRYE